MAANRRQGKGTTPFKDRVTWRAGAKEKSHGTPYLNIAHFGPMSNGKQFMLFLVIVCFILCKQSLTAFCPKIFDSLISKYILYTTLLLSAWMVATSYILGS